MRAVQIRSTGGPEVLEVADLPDPRARPGRRRRRGRRERGQLHRHLPALRACTACRCPSSWAARAPAGSSRSAPTWHDLRGRRPGRLAGRAGQLRRAGPRSRPRPACPCRTGVCDQVAAAILLQGMTAHYLCRSTYAVQPGDTVVVHAGAGGVGLLLTQLVRALGGHVITHRLDAGEGRAVPRGRRRARRRLRRAGRHRARGHRRRGRAGGLRRRRCRRRSRPRCAAPRRRGIVVLFGAASGPVPPFDLQRLNPAGSLFVTRPTLGDYVASPRGAALAGRRAVRRRRRPARWTSGSARPTRSSRPGRPTRTCRAAGRPARCCCSPADRARAAGRLRCAGTAPTRRAASATAASRGRRWPPRWSGCGPARAARAGRPATAGRRPTCGPA